MSRKRLLMACLVGLLGAVLAQAHEIKVLASRLVADKAGERTTIYLSWGHLLPVDELVEAQTVERYEVLAPSGTATPLKKEGLSLQANVVELKEEGLHQVVVARKPSIITHVIDKEGNRIMKRGPRTSVTEGTIEDAQRSQQFAKAVIAVGDGKEAAKGAGLALEIVPLDPPAAWRSGGALRFQVLFQGKPLAAETVVARTIGFKPDDAWCYSTTTGRDGVARVQVNQPGTWVLKVRHRQPAAGSAREQYDFESYTSTLALEVRP